MSMDDALLRRESGRRSALEMIGEFMREAAVLVAVFMPLDMTIEGKPWTGARLAGAAVISLGLLAVGVTIEKLRP
jgi:drug/metabolite transporter (DMT)-like permease